MTHTVTINDCIDSITHLNETKKVYQSARTHKELTISQFVEENPEFDDLLHALVDDTTGQLGLDVMFSRALREYVKDYIPLRTGNVGLRRVGKKSPRIQIVITDSLCPGITPDMVDALKARMEDVADVEVMRVTVQDEIAANEVVANDENTSPTQRQRAADRARKLRNAYEFKKFMSTNTPW